MATLTLLPDTGHNHHSSQAPHHAKQKCTSTTCCSPSRLWKSIQQLIAAHDKQGLIQLCQDPTKSSHVLSVLLSSRLTNDASLYPASNKHRVLNLATLGEKTTPLYRAKVTTLFGKSATDLNALQLALFHRQEGIACYLLQLIRQHAPEKDRSLFVNHLWGARNGSLHLACFLDMPRVVQLLLDMGVSPDAVNGKLKTPLDCCNDHDSASALDCRTLVEQALLIKHGKKLSVDTSSPSPSAALVKPLSPSSDTQVSMVVDDDKACNEKDAAGTTTACPDPVLVDAPWSMQVHSYDDLMAGSGYLGASVTYSPAGPLFKPKQDSLTLGSTPPLVDFVLPPFDLEEEDTDDDDDDDGGMKYQDICWSPPLLPLDDPFPHYGHGDDDDLNLDVLSLPLVLNPLGISPICGVPLEDDNPTSDLGASLDAGDTCQAFLEDDPCVYDAARNDDGGDDDPGKQQDHSSQTQWSSLDPSPVFSKKDGDPSDGGDSSQRFDDDHDGGGGGDRDSIPLDHSPAVSLKSPDPRQDQSHSNGWADASEFGNRPPSNHPGPNSAWIDLFAETNDGSPPPDFQRFQACILIHAIQCVVLEKEARLIPPAHHFGSTPSLGVLQTPSLVDAYT